jgi:Transposase DDE domain group 1
MDSMDDALYLTARRLSCNKHIPLSSTLGKLAKPRTLLGRSLARVDFEGDTSMRLQTAQKRALITTEALSGFFITLLAALAATGIAFADIGTASSAEDAAVAARPALHGAAKAKQPDLGGAYAWTGSYRGGKIGFHYAHGSNGKVTLESIIYEDKICFRGDAAFAMPSMYEYLESEGIEYAIRLPANQILQNEIAHLLRRPVGRPPHYVQRLYSTFRYQAGSWSTARRVVAKVEWHPGELFPRVGFIVTNLSRRPKNVVAFYNLRGTAEQHIKEGKGAIKWTRLSCRTFAANAVRLQLHALAYNLGNFLRSLVTPAVIADWTLTSLREKLIKIGAKVVSHGRYVTFQMAEVAIPRAVFAELLQRIAALRLRSAPAPT